ncbi:MAG: hypothetical protein JNN15_17330, partial [Blastocatellia bacterium]|nr:hypothetical protein [Blastocatellia bacterium]
MAVCSNPRCSESIPDGKYRCLKCQALATAVVLRSRYKIRNMVGKGGFGVTYLVDDLDCFSESRILKELCPEPHTNKPESELDNKDEVNQIAERLFQ